MDQMDWSINCTEPIGLNGKDVDVITGRRLTAASHSSSNRFSAGNRTAGICTHLTRQRSFRGQRGWTISEFLVAALLSIIVSGSAILVLSNALGSNARIMQRVQLSHELRNAMQMMSRDVRRAGYTAGSMWCLANTVCLPDVHIDLPIAVDLPLLSSIDMPAGIQINESNDCFSFELDRDHNGTVSADEHGAYRRRSVDGVGVLEVWQDSSLPDCTATSANWMAITADSRIDISNFYVDDDLSVEQQVSVDLLGNSTNQKIRRIKLQLRGRLVDEPELSEFLEDVIDVRNDILLRALESE